jgi:membrane-associated protease RseP (regulator of RpoE activity)
MVFALAIVGVGALLGIHELARHGAARALGLPIERLRIGRGPLWRHLAALVAGVVATYLGIAVIAFALFACHGLATGERWYGVASTVQGFDAFGKVVPGDRILAVDHVPLQIGVGDTLVERVNRGRGAPVTLTVRHAGETRDLSLQPRIDTDGSAWRLGIKIEEQTDPVTDVGLAIGGAVRYPIEQSVVIGRGLARAVAGSDAPDVGGPKRIVDELRRPPEPISVRATKLAMLFGTYLLWILIAVDLGRLVRARPS